MPPFTICPRRIPKTENPEDGEPQRMSDPSGSAVRALVDRSQPAASAIGLSMAALIMNIFGFVWLGWGFSVSQAFTDFSANRLLPAARWITLYVVFLALLGISIQALRRANA